MAGTTGHSHLRMRRENYRKDTQGLFGESWGKSIPGRGNCTHFGLGAGRPGGEGLQWDWKPWQAWEQGKGTWALCGRFSKGLPPQAATGSLFT